MMARIFISAGIFLPVFTLYLKTMPSTVFWQDSGLFLAGIKMLGVIFPPGFPLYIVLGFCWTKIISLVTPFNFAQQVHAFSAFWGALAAVLVGLSVYELIWQKERTNASKSNVLIAISSGLIAGFSYSLWSQSINAEVYSMTGFFTATLLLLIIKLIQNCPKLPMCEKDLGILQNKFQRYLIILAVIWGLSFGIHLLAITFAIPLFLLSFQLKFSPFIRFKLTDAPVYNRLAARRPAEPQDSVNLKDLPAGRQETPDFQSGGVYKTFLTTKTWILIAFTFLLSAVIPYLYLPIRSAADPLLLWARIDSPKAFVEHITGKIYRTSEGAIQAADLDKLRSYPTLFFQEFFVLGIILGVLGWWILYRGRPKPQRHFAFFGITYMVIIYALISFYQRGTEYNSWLIPFYLYWDILIGVGIWQITSIIKLPPLKTSLILLLTLGVCLPQLTINWPILNRSNYVLAEEFGKNLIGKLPENSVFFTMGDQESAIPLYLQQVLGYRKDVLVIAASNFVTSWQRQRLVQYHSTLIIPKADSKEDLFPEETMEVINDFISSNLPKVPIFVITKNYLALSPEFKLLPAGTVWKITTQDDNQIDLAFWDYSFSDPKRYQRSERPELSRKKTNYVQGKAMEDYERAPYYDEAKVFELQSKKNLADLCLSFFTEKKTLQVATASGVPEEWQGERLRQCAVESYEGMFQIDPSFYHRDVFSQLANLYKDSGEEDKAKVLLEKIDEMEKK